MIVRSTRVLDLSLRHDGFVTFTYPITEDADYERSSLVEISESLFVELGEPSQLTVTIEPGDKLNVEKPVSNEAEFDPAETYGELISRLRKQIDVLWPGSREKSLALTKLEEAEMWLAKADAA